MTDPGPANDLDIGALIGSRICHDLISPVGAIGNGVELLTMAGSVAGPELALISESVENANARIRFFRIAFGQASENQDVGRAEVLSILGDLYRKSRLQVDWTPQGSCPRRETQIAFLLIQCLDSTMPFGGKVHVAQDGTRWSVEGSSAKIRRDPDHWAALSGAPVACVSASHVHFLLVPTALARAGRTLTIEEDDETRIRIGF